MQAQGPGRFLFPRLGAAFYLEFAARGSWFVVIAGHMKHLGFSGTQIASVYAIFSLGAFLAPVFAGWLGDRVMPIQKLTGLCHLLAAFFMVGAWQQDQFPAFLGFMSAYALVTAPTPALTNAICFHHLEDPHGYARLRVFGTLGWMFANWVLSGLLFVMDALHPGESHLGLGLLIGGACSLLMAVYAVTLPHTGPVSREAPRFTSSLLRLTRGTMRSLLLCGFTVGVALPFLYNFTFVYLTDPAGMGFGDSLATAYISLGQVMEVVLMIILADCIRRFGPKPVMMAGLAGLALRAAIFSAGGPAWLVIAANTLHGVDYTFFYVVATIAAERLSPADLRATTQQLMLMVTHGAGMLAGHYLSGRLYDTLVLDGNSNPWKMFFLVPLGITAAAAAVLAAGFKTSVYHASVRTSDPAA